MDSPGAKAVSVVVRVRQQVGRAHRPHRPHRPGELGLRRELRRLGRGGRRRGTTSRHRKPVGRLLLVGRGGGPLPQAARRAVRGGLAGGRRRVRQFRPPRREPRALGAPYEGREARRLLPDGALADGTLLLDLLLRLLLQALQLLAERALQGLGLVGVFPSWISVSVPAPSRRGLGMHSLAEDGDLLLEDPLLVLPRQLQLVHGLVQLPLRPLDLPPPRLDRRLVRLHQLRRVGLDVQPRRGAPPVLRRPDRERGLEVLVPLPPLVVLGGGPPAGGRRGRRRPRPRLPGCPRRPLVVLVLAVVRGGRRAAGAGRGLLRRRVRAPGPGRAPCCRATETACGQRPRSDVQTSRRARAWRRGPGRGRAGPRVSPPRLLLFLVRVLVHSGRRQLQERIADQISSPTGRCGSGRPAWSS